MDKIKPLGSRILVMRSKSEQKKGSIMLLESAQKKENIGLVVAIGNDVKDISVGQKILFSAYDGTPVSSDIEDDYFIFLEKNIIAIIEE